MKQNRHLLVLAGLIAVGASAPLFAADPEQSPVDIRPEYTVYNPALPTLNYNYDTPATLHVFNNGSPDENATIRANITAPVDATRPNLVLSGETYNLLQFHFHTEAEHLKNGFTYPMEMHLVHQKAGSSGLNDLLVTGRWIEAGAHNDALDPIFSNLPPDTDPSSAYDLTGLDLSLLLPASLTSYRYPGSLTTPDFNEGVQWVMLDQPIELDHAQIEAFEALFAEGNAREPQPINARIIQTDNVSFVPETSSTMAIFALALTVVWSFRSQKTRRSILAVSR